MRYKIHNASLRYRTKVLDALQHAKMCGQKSLLGGLVNWERVRLTDLWIDDISEMAGENWVSKTKDNVGWI